MNPVLPPAAHSAPHPAAPSRTPDYGDLAVVLSGGGARGAYQVGLLRHLARRFPELRIPILVGVSAGAVNAAHLAQHQGTFPEAVESLARLWAGITPEEVFRVDALSLTRNAARWISALLAPTPTEAKPRGLLDTTPLGAFLRRAMGAPDGELHGIEENVRAGRLRAIALGTTSYTTGQSVVWVQGREIETWERPQRRAVQTRLRVEHVMASAALPLFFPAVKIDSAWYGDGGIRLAAPLSPALHLGAHKILTISTRYDRTQAEADSANVVGYPPPAQVMGVLYNAIFLDLIDQDALRLERMNRVLRKLPPEQRDGLRVVEMLVLRPSRDLGLLVREHELRLPKTFRFLTRRLGTRDILSPDILSLLSFQQQYLVQIMELGEADAERHGDVIAGFLNGGRATAA